MNLEEIKRYINSIGNEASWRNMSFDDTLSLCDSIVQLNDNDIQALIQSLSDFTFGLMIKKFWTEQDVSEEQNGYEVTYNIIIAIKRSLLLRLPIINDPQQKLNMQKQLIHASLIADTTLVEQAI
jgi:hypothetical protein